MDTIDTLDSAIQISRANLAGRRHCFATQQAFLDLACAIDLGATYDQLVVLSDYANLVSAKERAADIFQRDDFNRDNWLRRAEEITKARDEIMLQLKIR